jgi:hypothetical protein
MPFSIDMFANCLQIVKKEEGLYYRKPSSILRRGDPT